MAGVKLIMRPRSLRWKLSLWATIIIALLIVLNMPVHISMQLYAPARGFPRVTRRLVDAASAKSSHDNFQLWTTVVGNAVVLGVSGAIGWLILHFHRRAEQRLTEPF